MLELLLRQYLDQFGTEFPLEECVGMREIDVINLIYDCTLNNKPYQSGQEFVYRINDAPGQ